MYEYSKGFRRGAPGTWVNQTLAFDWYLKAAEQGDTEAQYILGRTYTDWGNHVIPQDYAEAYMWFNLCLRGGPDYVAERYRDELSLKMSQDQIAKGQAMTRKWLEDFEKRNQVRPL
jgi:TPR repeat protein